MSELSGVAADSGCDAFVSHGAWLCGSAKSASAEWLCRGCGAMIVFCTVQCMRCSVPLAQLPMSPSPLFLPLSLCHIESNGALIVEVRKNGDGRSGWAGGVDGGG